MRNDTRFGRGQPIILRVIQEFYPRVTGPANQAFRTSQTLAQLGWRSPIYTTRNGAFSAPRTEQTDGFTVHRFPYHGQLFRSVFSPELLAAVARAPATLMHVHQWRNPSADGAILIARARGIPLVVQPHGTAAGYRRMVEGMHALPFQTYDRAFGWLPRLAAAAVAATAGERDDLLAYGFRPEQVHIIPVGMDFRTVPAVPSRSSGAGRLLFVGRVGPDRRIEDLIRLLAVVSRSVPTASLRIVGRVDSSVSSSGKGYMPFLRDVIQEAGAGDRVQFVGEVTGSALWDEYIQADAYVNMSIYENFGQAFLEAAAMGLPLLSTPVGVAASLIVPGRTGYLIHGSDIEGASADTVRLLENAQMRHRMGREAAAVARRDYGIESVAEAYSTLYRKIMQNAHETTPKLPFRFRYRPHTPNSSAANPALASAKPPRDSAVDDQ